MKNTLLLIWNVLLTAAIVILFVMKQKQGSVTESTNTGGLDTSVNSTIRIAYIDLDSLQSNYELYSQKKKELDKKQADAEATFKKKMKAFEAEYVAAEQSAKYMTPEQIKQKEQELLKKQDDLQKLEEQLSVNLQQQLVDFNQQLQDSLDSFLTQLNISNPYTYILMKGEGSSVLFAQPQYDITLDAIKGMNERLKK